MKIGDLVKQERGRILAGAVGIVTKKKNRMYTITWLFGNTLPDGVNRLRETTSTDHFVEVLSESK